MLRPFFLILVLTACLEAQIHWKCDPKDGKFIMTPCATCEKFYCWDGEIFNQEQGYTPPPSYVLSYWEEVDRRSKQIRADIERSGKELREQVQKAQQETFRMNQERAQAHKEYMDDLHRRINESHSSPRSPRSAMTASTQRAVPKDVLVAAPEPATSAPALPPASRAKAGDVQVGMDRAAVEGLLGKPHSVISIPQDDGLVELLTYTLDAHSAAHVRIERGKVTSVKISD